MSDNFTKLRFEKIFNIESIIMLFYMEMSKNFGYDGEKHDFWEMVYIDKGEMICTAGKNRFVLKSGEMTFHKPNEFHNLASDGKTAPNISVITFECHSRAMKFLEGKIFRLDSEEKSLLSKLFEEGLSCYRLADPQNPFLVEMKKLQNAPFGSSQMTKNLLEIFLIKLYRHTEVLTKKMRRSYVIDGVDVPFQVKEILDFLKDNIYGRITIADVARKIGKSESSVKQIFASYRKNGIMRYYNQMKINEAKRLICESNYNMTQIADLLCFDNPQYFSKCFKEFANMTPSEYKAKIVK